MSQPTDTFDQLEATLLLCPRCNVATPQRKRLLLILPDGDKYEYLCAHCGEVCGEKIQRDAPGQRRYM